MEPLGFSINPTLLVAVLISGAITTANAETAGVENTSRASTNYMLNCQGCHGANASGNEIAEVPRMKDFVGNFLKVPGGREYLVQVPGSANASMGDAELAELLNWLLWRVSAKQMPEDFAPYTEHEISRLRYTPNEDVVGTRKKLIDQIASQ